MRPLRAAIFLVTHTVLACVAILCIYEVEKLIAYLWNNSDPLLLGFISLRYLFDAIDIAVITIFAVRGLMAIYRAFED